MNFNFPSFITASYKKLENIDYENPQNNVININNVDYIFKPLSEKGNKGGNSIILKLYENISFDNKEDYSLLDDKKPNSILKITNKYFEKGRGKSSFGYTHKRFLNEIQALKICKESQNVIEIYLDGECIINGKNYLFYTMEYADDDLKGYIEKEHSNLPFENKLKFCIEILNGINDLYSNELFHRDIKPDNIFIVEGKWKIADLGLVAGGRNLNYNFNEISEFIGPRGWISPEVMNKYLTENKNFKRKYDCTIDIQSDIFQLGKLFWYIFQHNAPIGAIKMNDFENEFSIVYPILKTMLNHDKKRRYKNIEEIIPLFKKIEKRLLFN
jgi:serine/threonine protein kinase